MRWVYYQHKPNSLRCGAKNSRAPHAFLAWPPGSTRECLRSKGAGRLRALTAFLLRHRLVMTTAAAVSSSTGAWRPLYQYNSSTVGPSPRLSHVAVTDGATLRVHGGFAADGYTCLSDAWSFDLLSETWSPMPYVNSTSFPSPRAMHSAVRVLCYSSPTRSGASRLRRLRGFVGRPRALVASKTLVIAHHVP